MKYLIILVFLTISTAVANTEFTESEIVEAEARSVEWGITTEDWHRYKSLLLGPRGSWSPNADPISILGASATDSAERRRLAEIFVRLEFKRAEEELAFQRAVNLAWKEVHPFPQRLPKSNREVPELLKAYRYAVIVEPDCVECKQMLTKYIKILRTGAASALDLYVRKMEGDDALLRRYVEDNVIPIQLIQSGEITVNHGTDYETGPVPEAWVNNGGEEWQLVQ